MLIWAIYSFSILFISLYLSQISSKKIRSYLFILILLLLITPSRIDSGVETLAPALFIFLFDILFEKNFSAFSLRPLSISLPLGLLFVFLIKIAKRNIFR